MRMTSRHAIIAAVIHGIALAPAWAENYPTAPIRIISGFPPGSTADLSARIVAARMGQTLGQQFVIENRPGAASSLAAATAARAPKDGYTLFVASPANIVNAAINPNLSFDFFKDFTPIVLITSTPTVLVVTPELGVTSVKELVAAARAKPDAISFGSSGIASSTHLALELFKLLGNVSITHVPYTGSPQVVTDLLAGRINGYFSPASTVMEHVTTGRLRALAVTDAKRSAIIPDLPTMIEAGIPDFESVLWFGLIAPTGTPQPVIDKLAGAANEALKSDEVVKPLHAQSIAVLGGTPDEFRRHIESERKRWTAVITSAGLRK